MPEWFVTFGDMMSLLLCFFILLQMFSELKRDHEYRRAITAIRAAFGYSGGVGVLPVDDAPVRSIIRQLEEMALRGPPEPRSSRSPTDSLHGAHLRVRRIRDGLLFTIAGPSFDEGSAELEPSVRRELASLSVLLAGRTNKIAIRGHAAPKYLRPDSPYRDLDELSFARARNVKDALTALGLEDRVFRLEAVGTREPVRPRALDAAAAAENRRVEIILTEELIDDSNADADFTDPDLARGGASRG